MVSLGEPEDTTNNADSWAIVPQPARNDCFTRGRVNAELLPTRAVPWRPVNQTSLPCEPKGPRGVIGSTNPWVPAEHPSVSVNPRELRPSTPERVPSRHVGVQVVMGEKWSIMDVF